MRLTLRERQVLWIVAREAKPVLFGGGKTQGLQTTRAHDVMIVEARGDAGASLERKGLLERDEKSVTGRFRRATQAGHRAAQPLLEAYSDYRDMELF